MEYLCQLNKISFRQLSIPMILYFGLWSIESKTCRDILFFKKITSLFQAHSKIDIALKALLIIHFNDLASVCLPFLDLDSPKLSKSFFGSPGGETGNLSYLLGFNKKLSLILPEPSLGSYIMLLRPILFDSAISEFSCFVTNGSLSKSRGSTESKNNKISLNSVSGNIIIDDNAAVVIDKQGMPKGTRILGPIAREVKEAGFTKIGSLAREVV